MNELSHSFVINGRWNEQVKGITGWNVCSDEVSELILGDE